MSVFYDNLCSFFKDKNVLILGFGREGRSTLRLLKRIGNCTVTIADMNDVSCPETEGIEVIYGENYLVRLGEFDIIMKAPGIALLDKVPEGVKPKITGQTDLLLRYCTNPVVGITGTKGKSTTSSLIYHILSRCGKNTVLIGNIGVPPLDCIEGLDSDTIIVCEMSCHQLEYVQASPAAAVYLNLFEEHLDHYVDFDAYRLAKENIYKYQKADSTLIINKSLLPAKTAAHVISASLDEPADICVDDTDIMIGGKRYSGVRTKLLGRHNLYNIGIAMRIAQHFGCEDSAVLDAVASFDGLKHRLENVGTVNGAEYINDSISTCPSTAIAAVRAFNKVDTIIIGGMDRGIDYTELVDFLNSSDIENIILLPDSGHKIIPRLDASAHTLYRAADMKDAVEYAKKVTKVRCILSPAAASYGFYKNFEERGDDFRQLVLTES